jgi:hypothetical protein
MTPYNWKNPDEIAAENNPRIAEKFEPIGNPEWTNAEPVPGQYARRSIIRTLKGLQDTLRQAEIDKQDAQFRLNAANALEDRDNHTYDELKAVLDSLSK